MALNKELIQTESFKEDFFVKNVVIGGDDCVLIHPKAFPKWNEENKYYRSSIWRLSDGTPVSLGFRKFTNLGEQPEFEPIDYSGDMEFIQKIDGSLLIASKYKKELILRTRGTSDLKGMSNSDEIPELLKKHIGTFNNELIDTEQYSFLFEWYSPKNVIVLREAAEPKLWLIGMIRHHNYSYVPQNRLDILVNRWQIDRPKRYSFNSIQEMTKVVENFESCEGVVLYTNDGQVLKKAKSVRYLYLHKIKSTLNNQEAILDFYLNKSPQTYEELKEWIIKDTDYEIFTQIEPELKNIFRTKEVVELLMEQMKDFVELLKGLSRKVQAQKIIERFGKLGYTSQCFNLLDGKDLSGKMIKEMYIKELEKE